MAKSGKSKAFSLKQRLSEKLEEYGEAIANNDVQNYILFLVLKQKKSKEDLLEDLKVFFKDQTDEFVLWLCNSSNNQEKIIKCRFFPNCRAEDCTYYHPTKKVEYN